MSEETINARLTIAADEFAAGVEEARETLDELDDIDETVRGEWTFTAPVRATLDMETDDE